MAKKKTQTIKTKLKCIAPDCNGTLARFQTSKKIGFDIMYFKCRKCNDLSYYFYRGDTYDREIFDLASYQSFLRSVDVEILSRKERERKLNEKEEYLIEKEQELARKGIKGLLGRMFKKTKEGI